MTTARETYLSLIHISLSCPKAGGDKRGQVSSQPADGAGGGRRREGHPFHQYPGIGRRSLDVYKRQADAETQAADETAEAAAEIELEAAEEAADDGPEEEKEEKSAVAAGGPAEEDIQPEEPGENKGKD